MRLDAELAQQSRRHHGIDGARVNEETQLGAAVWPGRIGDAQANMSQAHDLKTSLLLKVYHVGRHCNVVTFDLQMGSQFESVEVSVGQKGRPARDSLTQA